MQRSTADVIVKIFAVLVILGGIGMILGAFGLLGAAATALAMTFRGITSSPGVRTGFGVAAIVTLIIGIIYLLTGWGLWTHRNWARIIVLVLAWIAVIGAIVSFFGAGTATTGRGAIVGSALVSLIIAVLEIWFFQFTDATLSLFGARRTESASARPVAGKR
jgi:hypothetical protein